MPHSEERLLIVTVASALEKNRLRHVWRAIRLINYLIFTAVFVKAMIIGQDLSASTATAYAMKSIMILYVVLAAAATLVRVRDYESRGQVERRGARGPTEGRVMEPAKPTKTPTRDYQSFSGTPWPALDAMYARRSHRKYLPVDLDDEFVSGFSDIAARACAARGVEASDLSVHRRGGRSKAVRVGAYKGLAAKINAWLARAPVAAFLVIAVDEKDMESKRPSVLPRTAMACEDVVLWLTQQLMGTCWLGGVNAREVGAACGVAGGGPCRA